MRDLLSEYDRLAALGRPVGRAVVTSVWGSAPRPEGSSMLATADGTMAGSVSGGCVEGRDGQRDRRGDRAGHAEAGHLRRDPRARVGGRARVRRHDQGVRRADRAAGGACGRARTRRRRGGHAGRRTGGRSLGHRARGRPGGGQHGARPRGRRDPRRRARGAGARGKHDEKRRDRARSGQSVPGGVPTPAAPGRLRRRPHRGGTGPAGAIARLSHDRRRRQAGVPHPRALPRRGRADPRVARGSVSSESGWTRASYVCILSHDPKFDEPALDLALRSPARYVGAIGSRKTQASRRERLSAAGFDEETIARVHGPIGLDLGGRQPAETALAILAEMTAVRYGGSVARGARAD